MGLTRYHWILGATLAGSLAVCLLASGGERWLALGVVFTLGGLFIGCGVSFPQCQLFGRSLCRVATKQRVVALTFDDGPDPVNTLSLLTLLKERQALATFFVVGKRAEQHPDVIRTIQKEGHQVENHTYSHHLGTNFFSQHRLHEDFSRAQQVVRRLTERAPTYIRTPACLTNPRVFRVTRAMGLKVVGYTVRGRDQRARSVEVVMGRLARGIRPGAILLLHDGGTDGGRLLGAVGSLLDRLEAEGYRCLRLDELVTQEEQR